MEGFYSRDKQVKSDTAIVLQPALGDSLDWKDYGADAIIERVTKKVKNGSIVLFHNAAKYTPDALPSILEKLQADGYKIVPISELIYKDDFVVDSQGKQVLSKPNNTQ